jgi:hypothetical protein
MAERFAIRTLVFLGFFSTCAGLISGLGHLGPEELRWLDYLQLIWGLLALVAAQRLSSGRRWAKWVSAVLLTLATVFYVESAIQGFKLGPTWQGTTAVHASIALVCSLISIALATQLLRRRTSAG